MKKIIFNWARLNRFTLIDMLKQLGPTVVGHNLEVQNFHQIFSKHIKQQLPVKVTKHIKYDVEKNGVHIGGAYYYDLDRKHKTCVELRFVYHAETKYIKLTKHKFQRICRIFADTILHELLHMRQYRRRKFKVLPDYVSVAINKKQRKEQSYLGSIDEIDAYSFNIACELIDKYKTDTVKIIEHLDDYKRYRKTGKGCWNMYLAVFDNNRDHIVIKHLKQKIIKYLPNALTVGKPYKSNSWVK